MKSKKSKLSAIVFFSVMLALALALPDMTFGLQYGDFTYEVSGGTVTITGYNCPNGVPVNPSVVIPSAIEGMPVVGIGDEAFDGCIGLTSVTIGNGVTSIGDEAFYYCSGLTSVTIGNSVTSIGGWAFSSCTGLTSIIIPDSVTSIGDGAFDGCYSLTSVTIGNSVTSIGYQAFGRCSSLTRVTIPNSVTSIGDGAFYDCSSLTSIVVDASNTAYSSQDGVLYDKAKTVLIQYPESKLGGFTIPDSVMSIGAGAFYGCIGLTRVTIPDSVTSIGGGAFGACHSLTSVTIGNSVTSIGNYAFYFCSSLTSVTIPDSVTSIGGGAFDGCYSLTSVTIGNSVTSIGDKAFYYCIGLVSVTIPDSVTRIGAEAFAGCSSLTKAYFLGNAPSMAKEYQECTRFGCIYIRGGVFYGCANNFIICYTAESTGFTTPTWYGYPAAICEEPTTTTTTTISSWSCAVDFIYGEDSEQTELLREYRDKVLSKTPEGQELIKTYYKLSPSVTKLLEQRPLLKNRAKVFVDNMLPYIRKKVEESQSKNR